MKLRAVNLFLLQLALLLLLPSLAANASQASGYKAANARRSSGTPLTDAEIKTMLRDYIASDKLGVGLVVGIVDTNGPRVVSCGKLDNGTDASVSGDTLFEIGSITKVFTALLLQNMVDHGEMKLDDPVQKYLPKSVKMPTYHGKHITLLELATQTHEGLTLGYRAELAFDTKKRRGVVVLSNCASSRRVDSMWRPLLEGRSPQPAGTVPIDAALYDR